MKKQQNKWYDFILRGIIYQLQEYLKNTFGITMDVTKQKEFGEFISQNVNGMIRLEVVDKLPILPEGSYHEIDFETHILKLLFVKDGVGKYVLYAHVEVQYEAVFRKRWLKHYLPKNLLEEAIPLVNLTKPIVVVAYERPSLWREMYEKAHGSTLIGQKINPETGYFVERKPIGYVQQKGRDCWVVITAPNERLDYTGLTIKFNI